MRKRNHPYHETVAVRLYAYAESCPLVISLSELSVPAEDCEASCNDW